MKKTTKIILTGFLILLIGVFIHPKKVIYEAKIVGKVIDESGNPIKDAIVYRVEEKSFKNKEIGSIESLQFKSQTVTTDASGNFQLHEKSRIEWIHSPLDLPFVWCHANFQVSKDGFKVYKTKFGDFEKFRNENCYACENIEFKPTIILIKKND